MFFEIWKQTDGKDGSLLPGTNTGKSEKSNQGLLQYVVARATLKSQCQYCLYGRESSSYKEVVSKDRERNQWGSSENKYSNEKYIGWKIKTISLGKRATTLSGGVAWGVGGGAEGSHLPSSSWQPTAGLLRRGFHWRHEFLSLVTGTTEGHVMKEHRKSLFTLEFPQFRERGNLFYPWTKALSTHDESNLSYLVLPMLPWVRIKPKCFEYWEVCWRGVYAIFN